MQRFSPEDVQLIVSMASAGCTAIEVAKALGRTPLSVRHKACEQGITFRRPRGDRKLLTKLTPEVWDYFAALASDRGTSVAGIVRQLLVIIARQKLIDAVIDSGPLNPVRKPHKRYGRRRRSRYPPLPENTFTVNLPGILGLK